MNHKRANAMKMWKGNRNTTTLSFSVKALQILHEEGRARVRVLGQFTCDAVLYFILLFYLFVFHYVILFNFTCLYLNLQFGVDSFLAQIARTHTHTLKHLIPQTCTVDIFLLSSWKVCLAVHFVLRSSHMWATHAQQT